MRLPAHGQVPPAARAKIVAAIRDGAFEQVAVERAGIPFESYLAFISRKGSANRSFAIEVMVARAEARYTAETKLHKSDPKTWLKSGPGRERMEAGRLLQGWTDAPASPPPPKNPVNVLVSQQNSGLAEILKLLEPHPELRQAVALAIADQPPHHKLPYDAKALAEAL